MEMHSLAKGQQYVLVDLFPLSPYSKSYHIKYNEGDSRLALRLVTAEYQMAGPKPKITVLSMRYSISHSMLYIQEKL